MDVFEIIKTELGRYGIEYIGFASLDKLQIKKPHLINRLDFTPKSAVILLVPYKTDPPSDKSNISKYAYARDYHLFFNRLFDDICPSLENILTPYKFAGFADHSPIDEREAAVKCGLGVLGDNGLIINEKYGSYVFIGEILTDAPIESNIGDIKGCLHCGKCRMRCPSPEPCLSDITQKKGELSENEISLMRENNTVWGCDVCQSVCPMNEGAKDTEIEFFKSGIITYLDKERLDLMDDSEFSERAYSWRGRELLLRNLNAIEK